jgi:hypothetical protein
MDRLRLICASLVGGVLFGQPAQAATLVPDFSNGPVVFDFEDGLQGRTPAGGAERVPTTALEGQWAIRGDGLQASCLDIGGRSAIGTVRGITLTVDLGLVGELSLELWRSSSRMPRKGPPHPRRGPRVPDSAWRPRANFSGGRC